MNSYKTLIPRMTLQEKAALLGGKGEWEIRDIPRLGIPSMVCSDGPSGLRRQAGTGDHLGLNPSLPATCFPCPSLMACSWDQELEEAIGAALGEEAADQGVDILLGPGLNIKRNPLCGRNFEYFSEDPYFSGKMAAAFIRGVESQGIAACPKHFAVNSQELRRMAMNAVVDERTLREYGEEIAAKNIKERFARGISYISDDRHQDGLILDMNVEENLILRQYERRPYLKSGIFQKNIIRENAVKAIEKYRIKTSGTSTGDTQVKLMSGGNQQKIVLAREITEHSKLIIASQPTRGLDIGATQFVRQVLMEQRNEGKSVILISADLEEIMQLSDRVAVMFGGKIVGILKKEEAELEKIGLLMGGITKEETN